MLSKHELYTYLLRNGGNIKRIRQQQKIMPFYTCRFKHIKKTEQQKNVVVASTVSHNMRIWKCIYYLEHCVVIVAHDEQKKN